MVDTHVTNTPITTSCAVDHRVTQAITHRLLSADTTGVLERMVPLHIDTHQLRCVLSEVLGSVQNLHTD